MPNVSSKGQFVILHSAACDSLFLRWMPSGCDPVLPHRNRDDVVQLHRDDRSSPARRLAKNTRPIVVPLEMFVPGLLAWIEPDLPVLRQTILAVSHLMLCSFAFFDELFPSGHKHAATGELAGHLDFRSAEQARH